MAAMMSTIRGIPPNLLRLHAWLRSSFSETVSPFSWAAMSPLAISAQVRRSASAGEKER